MLTLAALLLVHVAAHDPVPPPPRRLANDQLRVTLGARGLSEITDVRERRSHRIVEDGFVITVDGQRFDSRNLAAPSTQAEVNVVTYTWRSASLRIDVRYELRPSWAFVSKQLFVSAPASSTMRVGEVMPLRATLGETPIDHVNPGHPRGDLETRDYGTALRFSDDAGLLVVAQNPFLRIDQERANVSLSYPADMAWRGADPPFPADRVLIAPYRLSGTRLPERMRAEWRMRDSAVAPGLDEREVNVFTEMVRAFLLYKPTQPSSVFVGWTANDYQIDVGTPEGRAEYKRLIDRAAEIGARHVLYAPANSLLSRRRDSADDWSWEYVLWLGMGERIRRNEWSVATGEIPPSVKEMVDYSATRGVRLLAYVYPVLGFTQDTSWLVAPRPGESKRFSDLGVRALQDWLITSLVTFQRRTGIAGYSFDHTFLTYSRTSRYAQWFGWRRVMEELRRQLPDIVIDGRQAYHQYGPWSWLAGSYPHPTANDEQPESFVPFPDLHFDRVSADRERYTAYRYRNYEFAPSEIVPGYMTHQTSRGDDTGEMPEGVVGRDTIPVRFRARDWDYLGWRYSVLSSIAIAGWNNVIDMIPARDSAEYHHFSADDIKWWRQWIDWTSAHKELLRRTRTILGEPRLGAIDGTSAIDGDSGFVFLFNPNGRRLTARVALDASIGLRAGQRYDVQAIYPRTVRLAASASRALPSRGDTVELMLDGGSAAVVRIAPAPVGDAPLLFGTTGNVALQGGTLRVTGASGEVGTSEAIAVTLPASSEVRELRVNDVVVPFTRSGAGVVAARVTYAGQRFGRYEPIVTYDSQQTGGRLTATLTIPKRVFEQLAARRAAWPIPWTPDDYRSTSLASERPLLYVQIAEPDERWTASLRIDGRPVELRKAYTAIRSAPRTFVGFYADLSLLDPDRAYSIELELPALRPGQLQGVYLENIEPEYTTGVVH